jgi:hypothetical protein
VSRRQRDRDGDQRDPSSAGGATGGLGPAKRTLTEQIPSTHVGRPAQGDLGASGPSPTSVREAAAHGVATPASPLPHAHTIDRLFGRHDVSSIQAHQGPQATASAQAMGAQAYATGNHVVLGGSADLHTVAHEAAHVVQQRGGVQLKGGVGGAMVRTEELVLRFRMAAEVLQFLTGEQRDAPTLREFNHVSGMVGIAAGAAVLTPALVELAAAEAPLLAFAGRLSAQRVALWAAAHPVAALAASEALFAVGLQIGEGGWESFWGQLADPHGRWFVLAQVLMDYMHVRGSLGGHRAAPTASSQRAAPARTDLDVEPARQRIARARDALRQVHDAAASAERQADS